MEGLWNDDHLVVGGADPIWDLTDEQQGFISKLKDQLDFLKFLKDPTSYIQQIFVDTQNVVEPLEDWSNCVFAALDGIYSTKRATDMRPFKLKCLNDDGTTKVRNGEVVTFRCQIQNELQPEYIPPAFRTIVEGTNEVARTTTLFWDDTVDLQAELYGPPDEPSYLTRNVYVGVAPTGETPWVLRSDGHADIEQETVVGSVEENMENLDLNGDPNQVIDISEYCKDKVFDNLVEGPGKHLACLLKVPNTSRHQLHIRLNNHVEVAGVIYFPGRVDCDADSGAVFTTDYDRWKLSIPHIHVFSVLQLSDGNPRLPIIEGRICPIYPTVNVDLVTCFKTLLELFELVFCGDRVPATYAITSLLSRLYRMSGDEADPQVGNLVVNIHNVEPKSGVLEALEKVVRGLLPRVARLDVSIANLNSWKLNPKKNVDTDRLESGLLQLTRGTQLILNETELEQGNLTNKGSANAKTLIEFFKNRVVEYDFPFHPVHLLSDVPILVVSKFRSIFKQGVGAHVPMSPKSPFDRVQANKRIDEILESSGFVLRNYLSVAKTLRLNNVPAFADDSLALDLRSYLEVRNGVGFKQKMNQEEMSGFIGFCRYISVLHGERSCTRDHFQLGRDLDSIRDSRQ